MHPLLTYCIFIIIVIYLFMGIFVPKPLKNRAIFEDFFLSFYFFNTASKSSGGFQLAENVKFDLLVYFPYWLYIVQCGWYSPTFKLNLQKYSDSFTKEFLPNAGYTGIYPLVCDEQWTVEEYHTTLILKKCSQALYLCNEVASRTTIRYQC